MLDTLQRDHKMSSSQTAGLTQPGMHYPLIYAPLPLVQLSYKPPFLYLKPLLFGSDFEHLVQSNQHKALGCRGGDNSESDKDTH